MIVQCLLQGSPGRFPTLHPLAHLHPACPDLSQKPKRKERPFAILSTTHFSRHRLTSISRLASLAQAFISIMATFETPMYSVPSSPFSGALWTSWNIDSSPISSQDDGTLKLDSLWQSPLYYSIPDFNCIHFENWSNQSTTIPSSFTPPEHSASLGQFSNCPFDMTDWTPSLETFPVPFSAPIASPSTHDLISQCNTSQDYSSDQSGSTISSNHSSPSESNTAPSPPTLSTQARPRPNRVSKPPIRCWEHSCGGRAFSSLGNYERHLREKSGRAKSFTCEQCGQRFTRSTAKNKHIRHGRCRVR
ncbi:hypothetical protein BDV12DRAFT_166964 [Aspergillus spectabilis]